MQMREQRRAPRAGRQQPSGAQNRKTAAVSSEEASSRNRERNRASYHRKIQEARQRYAWEIGQRVRILNGKLAGECGAVMQRSDKQHMVRLDSGKTAQFPPDQLEAWPSVGQRISWLAGEDGEVATVVQFLKGYEEPKADKEKGLPAHRWRAGYKLMRIAASCMLRLITLKVCVPHT